MLAKDGRLSGIDVVDGIQIQPRGSFVGYLGHTMNEFHDRGLGAKLRLRLTRSAHVDKRKIRRIRKQIREDVTEAVSILGDGKHVRIT